MDKKKQFQKQVLESKIKEHTTLLSTLEKSYNDLIYTSNITLTDSTRINTSSITNYSINIDNLNKLQQHKSSLENTKKTIKQTINNVTTQLSQLEHNLTLLPLNTKDTLRDEIQICNDEHQRIESDRLETINSNSETIAKANLDKEQLLKDIEFLKEAINLQSNVITNIQKECHCSRKNILESLKEKKQLKNKLNNSIEDATLTKNSFIQQIDTLNNTIENLIEFKKCLVNDEYNDDTSDDTSAISTELNHYYNLYSIDSSILLNDKLSKIDELITTTKTQLLLFNKKLSKTELLTNYTIKDTITNYNIATTSKVLTYKDKFKIEKEKQTQLELSLDNKLNLYNNYQTLILDKINCDFNTKLECLNVEKEKADTRLHIIKLRMNKEYENNKKTLRKNIENTKQELVKNHNYIHDITNTIKKTTKTIEETTIVNDELYILENKIKTQKEIISITQRDLNIINNQ